MKEKNNIKSGIRGAGKSNPFSVPGNYFESFPGRLQRRLETEKQPRILLAGKSWQALRPKLALAAAIIAFAMISYLGFRAFVDTGEEWPGDEYITEYIEYYRHEFSEYELISLLEENHLYPDSDIYFDGYIYPDEPDPYMDYLDAYIDYLDQDNINIDLIIEEF